jgi:xanthine dehydrogenase YagT iron-sulfur-binding subunit
MTYDKNVEQPSSLTRRDFLRGGALVGIGAATAAQARAHSAGFDQGAEPSEQAGAAPVVHGRTQIRLTINDQKQTLHVEPRTSLLEALRVHLSPPLTGTKLVCDGGSCGACTVLFDGEPTASCMVLALDAVGHTIRTVEGEGSRAALSPLQASFAKHDGAMCGFCTSGFVMSLTAALEANPTAGEPELRTACAGNLCRCGTYPQVFEAALGVARGER